MTHDEIKAELSSYALGALDAEEQRIVENHLASGCDECNSELEAWQEVVGAVALAGPEQQLPELKRRLLSEVRPAPSAKVVPLYRRVAVPLALAATVLLVLSVAALLRSRRDAATDRALVDSMRTQLADAKGQLQQLTETLATKERDASALRAALAAANQAVAIIQRPGLQMVHLKETPDAKPAEAHLLLSSESNRALFYAFDLPPVTSDKAYELWWITEKNGPMRAAVFTPDARGIGRVEATLPTDAGTIQAAAVTIEPSAGVPKPTGPMVLLGKA